MFDDNITVHSFYFIVHISIFICVLVLIEVILRSILVIMTNISPNEHRHVLIARPAGLPGYAPREWCAVCGKASGNGPILKCLTTDCPNVCHITCLDESENFTCTQVPNLRTALNILDGVIYVDGPQSTDQAEVPVDNEDINEELLLLGSNELVAIIRRLQTELTRKNNILSFFSSMSHNIAKQRDALTTLLQFIDNVTATTSSLEELEVKSTACTARPDKIDEDWLMEINSNTQLQAWWISDKPRKLKKVCYLEEKTDASIVASSNSQQAQISQKSSTQQISSRTSEQPTPQEFNQEQLNHNRSSHTASQNLNRMRRNNFVNNRQETRQSPQYQNSRKSQGSYRQPRQTNYNQSTSQRQYCNFCRRSGHSDSNCFKQKNCDYCHRQGHHIQDCRTRLSEERQEHLLKTLSSEQAQHNTLLVQSLQRYWSPLQVNPNPVISNTGVWQSYPSYHPPQQPLQNHQLPPQNHQQLLQNNHHQSIYPPTGTWHNGAHR